MCIYFFSFLKECSILYSEKDNDWTWALPAFSGAKCACFWNGKNDLVFPLYQLLEMGEGWPSTPLTCLFSASIWILSGSVGLPELRESPVGLRSSKLQELGGGVGFLGGRHSLSQLCLDEPDPGQRWGPQQLLGNHLWQCLPHCTHVRVAEGLRLLTPPRRSWFRRWCPSCWGRHHTSR